MLVERRAVEPAEPVRVGREMPRHPVEPQPDPGPMARVDKGAEIVRAAMPRGRREQRDRLVAPRAVEREFGDRQYLYMREAEIGDVRHELLGQFAVGQVAAALPVVAAPGAEMHLVYRDRRLA